MQCDQVFNSLKKRMSLKKRKNKIDRQDSDVYVSTLLLLFRIDSLKRSFPN